jgi:hypothetical protein
LLLPAALPLAAVMETVVKPVAIFAKKQQMSSSACNFELQVIACGGKNPFVGATRRKAIRC